MFLTASKDLLPKPPSIVYFEPWPADRLYHSRCRYRKIIRTAAVGRYEVQSSSPFWISVQGSSCNDLPKTVLEPYRQARAQNIQVNGLLMTKSLNHINKHQGGSHSENVCFCVREEHPSCLWTRSIRDQCFHPQNSQALQRFWPPIKFLRPNAFKWFTICRKI